MSAQAAELVELQTELAKQKSELATATTDFKKNAIKKAIDEIEAEIAKLKPVAEPVKDPRESKETMMKSSVFGVKSTSNSYEGLDQFINDNCEFGKFDLRQTKDKKSVNFGKFHYVTCSKTGESSGAKSDNPSFIPMMAMFYLAALAGQLFSEHVEVSAEKYLEWIRIGEEHPLEISKLDFVATAKVELIGDRAGIKIPL